MYLLALYPDFSCLKCWTYYDIYLIGVYFLGFACVPPISSNIQTAEGWLPVAHIYERKQWEPGNTSRPTLSTSLIVEEKSMVIRGRKKSSARKVDTAS